MAPRACSWNTASTFMDLERLQSIDELAAEADFLPHVPQPAHHIVTAAPFGQVQTNLWMPSLGEPQVSLPSDSVPPPPIAAAPVAAGVLRLAEAIAPPELGSRELPSIGSMLHHKGGCRPCTFFHTRGCENKEDCKFCHLCGPGEKKKRLKQLKAAQREATWIALENAKATLASYNAGQLPEENIEADMIIE